MAELAFGEHAAGRQCDEPFRFGRGERDVFHDGGAGGAGMAAIWSAAHCRRAGSLLLIAAARSTATVSRREDGLASG